MEKNKYEDLHNECLEVFKQKYPASYSRLQQITPTSKIGEDECNALNEFLEVTTDFYTKCTQDAKEALDRTCRAIIFNYKNSAKPKEKIEALIEESKNKFEVFESDIKKHIKDLQDMIKSIKPTS